MMQPVRFFMVMSNSYQHHPNAWVRPSLETTAREAHSSLHLSCVGAPSGGAAWSCYARSAIGSGGSASS